MKYLQLALGACLTVSAGCYRTVRLPPEEAMHALEAASEGRAATVRTLDGERRRILQFTRVEVVQEEHCENDWCYRPRYVFDAPLQVELRSEMLVLRDRGGIGRFSHAEVPEIRLAERSSERTWIVVGTALGVGLAAFGLSFQAARQFAENDPHGSRQVLLPLLAMGAAGSASLAVSLPATADLGDEVD